MTLLLDHDLVSAHCVPKPRPFIGKEPPLALSVPSKESFEQDASSSMLTSVDHGARARFTRCVDRVATATREAHRLVRSAASTCIESAFTELHLGHHAVVEGDDALQVAMAEVVHPFFAKYLRRPMTVRLRPSAAVVPMLWQ